MRTIGGTTIVGIDPGAKGAIACFLDGKLNHIEDMPTVTHKGKPRVDGAAVGAIIRSWGPEAAFMERVGAMPGQGVVSMFTFGMAAGIVLGALGALLIPVTLITPAQWKVALRVPAAKDGARARASQLIPAGASWWPLVKHDGRAEAALIGLYGMRIDRPQIEW
jgi:crossover junction endodeoxyribonuclease RuvC